MSRHLDILRCTELESHFTEEGAARLTALRILYEAANGTGALPKKGIVYQTPSGNLIVVYSYDASGENVHFYTAFAEGRFNAHGHTMEDVTMPVVTFLATKGYRTLTEFTPTTDFVVKIDAQ